MGGQASWLLPAALLALGAGLIATRRAPRTDRTRAALLLWGGWLIVSGLVFSLSSGIIHTYYTVALAPAIAALVAIGGRMLWVRRDTSRARVSAAVVVAVSAGWAWELLDRTPSWEPWLRTTIVIAAVASVAALLASAAWRPVRGRLGVVAVVLGRDGVSRRAGGLRRPDGHDRAHRLDPLGGAGKRRRDGWRLRRWRWGAGRFPRRERFPWRERDAGPRRRPPNGRAYGAAHRRPSERRPQRRRPRRRHQCRGRRAWRRHGRRRDRHRGPEARPPGRRRPLPVGAATSGSQSAAQHRAGHAASR